MGTEIPVRPENQAEWSAALRVRDAWNLHKLAGSYDKWIACRLNDGTSDGVIYDSKRDAVRSVSDERWFMFLCITPASMNGAEALTLLRVHRRMYDAGIRMADPDDAKGGRDVITRVTTEDQRNLASAMAGIRPPSNITFRR